MLAIGHTVSPGASIRTDALASYARLPSMGYNHLPEKSLGGRSSAVQFKLVHRHIANFQSWLLGAHRNNCRTHLDLYAAEFTWRTNRRHRYHERKSDQREQENLGHLLTAMVNGRHGTWNAIREQAFHLRKRLAA
jgi:hypothetical protein